MRILALGVKVRRHLAWKLTSGPYTLRRLAGLGGYQADTARRHCQLLPPSPLDPSRQMTYIRPDQRGHVGANCRLLEAKPAYLSSACFPLPKEGIG